MGTETAVCRAEGKALKGSSLATFTVKKPLWGGQESLCEPCEGSINSIFFDDLVKTVKDFSMRICVTPTGHQSFQIMLNDRLKFGGLSQRLDPHFKKVAKNFSSFKAIPYLTFVGIKEDEVDDDPDEPPVPILIPFGEPHPIGRASLIWKFPGSHTLSTGSVFWGGDIREPAEEILTMMDSPHSRTRWDAHKDRDPDDFFFNPMATSSPNRSRSPAATIDYDDDDDDDGGLGTGFQFHGGPPVMRSLEAEFTEALDESLGGVVEEADGDADPEEPSRGSNSQDDDEDEVTIRPGGPSPRLLAILRENRERPTETSGSGDYEYDRRRRQAGNAKRRKTAKPKVTSTEDDADDEAGVEAAAGDAEPQSDVGRVVLFLPPKTALYTDDEFIFDALGLGGSGYQRTVETWVCRRFGPQSQSVKVFGFKNNDGSAARQINGMVRRKAHVVRELYAMMLMAGHEEDLDNDDFDASSAVEDRLQAQTPKRITFQAELIPRETLYVASRHGGILDFPLRADALKKSVDDCIAKSLGYYYLRKGAPMECKVTADSDPPVLELTNTDPEGTCVGFQLGSDVSVYLGIPKRLPIWLETPNAAFRRFRCPTFAPDPFHLQYPVIVVARGYGRSRNHMGSRGYIPVLCIMNSRNSCGSSVPTLMEDDDGVMTVEFLSKDLEPITFDRNYEVVLYIKFDRAKKKKKQSLSDREELLRFGSVLEDVVKKIPWQRNNF